MRVRNRLPILMGERRINSISQLSRDTKIHYGTLNNFYHERFNHFNGDLVVKLCKYFGCSVGDLLYLEDEGQAS